MGVIFAVRSDSFTARYSNGGASPGFLRTSAYYPTVTVDAAAIGGYKFAGGSFYGARGLTYPGFKNAPSGLPMSMLVRLRATTLWTTFTQNVMYIGNPMGAGGYFSREVHSDQSGNIFILSRDDNAGVRVNNVNTTHGLSDNTAYYDIVLTDTGGTDTNGCKLYINGTLKIQTTPTVALSSEYLQNNVTLIGCGVGNNKTAMEQDINEIVVWDEVIDPTSVTLTSGSGSLNGSSRTAFVDVAAYDGTAGNSGGSSLRYCIGN